MTPTRPFSPARPAILASASFLALALALALGAGLPGGPAALAQETDAEAASEAGSEPATEPAAEGETAEGETAEGDAGGDPLAGLDADTVIATVGDYDLTLGELIAVRQALPEQYQSLPPEVLTEGLVEQLVNQTVLFVRAREEDLDERVDIRLQILNQRNSTLADAFMRAQMRERITEERIQAAYEAQYAEAEAEEEVRAAHILVATEEEARALKEQLDAGADFAELAAEHGTDGTASRGGDLGYFSEGDMVPQFAEAAFAMEEGTISAPVQTPFGWHLIKLDDRREKPVPPLSEVRQQVVEGLVREAQQEIVAEAREAVSVSRPEESLPPTAILADELITPESADPEAPAPGVPAAQ